MGRYYSGDIEGKFWFGVQASDDALHFGATESEPNYINYYCDDIDAVQKGIDECLEVLGDDLLRLDEFFNQCNGYNDDMIKNFYREKYGIELSSERLNTILEHYARYLLGEQIYDCIKQTGSCSFTAEL